MRAQSKLKIGKMSVITVQKAQNNKYSEDQRSRII